MTKQEYMNKIKADMDERQLCVSGVVASNPATGKLQFITYDPKGLVSTISEPSKAISIYRKDDAENRGMYEVMTLSGIKYEPKPVTELKVVK